MKCILENCDGTKSTVELMALKIMLNQHGDYLHVSLSPPSVVVMCGADQMNYGSGRMVIQPLNNFTVYVSNLHAIENE